MELIDQVLWEQELTEYLHRDTDEHTDEPARFEEPPPDSPPAEPSPEPLPEPAAVESGTAWPWQSAVVLTTLWALAILALGTVGWSIGWFVI